MYCIRDDRADPAAGGELEGDAGSEGIPGDVEVADPELVHLTFDCVGQGRGAGQGICRKLGGAAEAREVQRDYVTGAAEGVLNRTPPGG